LRDWLRRKRSIEQVANRPDTISSAKRHGGRLPQAFVIAAQIVMRDIQRDGSAVIFEPL
jgi:hypothetical protein